MTTAQEFAMALSCLENLRLPFYCKSRIASVTVVKLELPDAASAKAEPNSLKA